MSVKKFANAIQDVLDQHGSKFDELNYGVQKKIIELIKHYEESTKVVNNVDDSSGLAAEGLVQVAMLLATNNGDYIEHATLKDQTKHDIDFKTKRGAVSVKAPLNSSPAGRRVGARHTAFNVEMWAGDDKAPDNENRDNTGWGKGWGQTGKADILAIVARDRVIAYDYGKLKKKLVKFPVVRNTPEKEAQIKQSGRRFYKTKTTVVNYGWVKEEVNQEMTQALGFVNIHKALQNSGYRV